MERIALGTLVLVGLFFILIETAPFNANEDDIISQIQQETRNLNRQKRQAGSTCSLADIVFVLDSSGSIKLPNWLKVLEFVKNIVRQMPIGEYSTRVGVVTYGGMAYPQIYLNDTAGMYLNSLLDKIDTIKWEDQSTNTSGGIWFAKDKVFSPSRGARRNAPDLMIVMTDGASNRDAHLTCENAKQARAAGITILAIGVGNDVNQTELACIANKTELMVNTTDFSTLPQIESALVSVACDIPVACTSNADIFFILDASGSVAYDNFETMKEFIKGIVSNLNVFESESNIGLITFSDSAEIHFGLSKYDSRQDYLDAISGIQYKRGTTNTAEALRLVRENGFQNSGDRPNLKNLVVLFTDGGSNSFDETIKQARLTREAGIHIIVVAVGGWLNMIEIKEIASDPDSQSVYQVDSFRDLNRISGGLKQMLCDDFDECASNPCKNGGRCIDGINKFTCECAVGYAGLFCDRYCPDPADVIFAIDSSGSIGQENYYTVLDFAKTVVGSLNVGVQTRVGIETFANDKELQFNLNSFETRDDVINAISFPYTRGTTNTASALKYMTENMFDDPQGDRINSRNLGIVITDGESNDRKETFQMAVNARQSGIDLISVGINLKSKFGQQELRALASDPDEKNMFNVQSYEGLYNLTDTLVAAVCNSVNECATNPCLNGGTCLDGINGYSCKCPEGRTGLRCERGCDGRADVVFVIDASGSIRENRFDTVLQFIQSVVEQMEVSTDRVRVGAMTYSDNAYIQFHLNSFFNKGDVLQAIERLDWVRGRTHTAEALRLLRTEMFQTFNGDRQDVPNYAIVITDGESNINEGETLPEAIQDRIAGIHMTAVTVGDKASFEIKGIASDPDSSNVIVVPKFSNLPDVTMNLVEALCDDQDECASNPCNNGGECMNGLKQYTCLCYGIYTGVTCERQCGRRHDLVFVLDTSGSVEETFTMMLDLVRNIVYGLNFEGGRTRVGLVTYSDKAEVRFHLNTYTSKMEVLTAIAFTQEKGRTNTAAGLNAMRLDMFTVPNGDRFGDPNTAIVITDGRSNINRFDTIPAADSARRNDITVYGIGIGENGKVDRAELNGIANDPDSDFASILEFDYEVDQVAERILDLLCR